MLYLEDQRDKVAKNEDCCDMNKTPEFGFLKISKLRFESLSGITSEPLHE